MAKQIQRKHVNMKQDNKLIQMKKKWTWVNYTVYKEYSLNVPFLL